MTLHLAPCWCLIASALNRRLLTLAHVACPQDYARVFAFENPKRTQRRAKEAAARVGAAGDPNGVPAGTYVELHVADMPAEAAARVLARVAATAQVRAWLVQRKLQR